MSSPSDVDTGRDAGPAQRDETKRFRSSEPRLEHEVRRRLALLRHVEEVSGNVAKTCRHYGISRPTYYKWLHRYKVEGIEGLRDRSTPQRASANDTHTELVHKITHLRRQHHFGPRKIVMHLQRHHEITISVSSVWRILRRLDMNRLPASQRSSTTNGDDDPTRHHTQHGRNSSAHRRDRALTEQGA